MRFIVFAVILITTTTPIYEQNWMSVDICYRISKFAELVMEARQRGIPINEVMQSLKEVLASDNPGIDATFKEHLGAIITIAYKIPRYHSREDQFRTIEYFRDTNYSKCLERLKLEHLK